MNGYAGKIVDDDGSSSAEAESCGYPIQGRLIGLPREKGEEWSRVEGFPRYWVSTHGRIYSEPTQGRGTNGGLMSPSDNGNGYGLVHLWKNGEPQRAETTHRLVMEVHGPDPPTEKHEFINHIDGNKRNNRIENLEWVTPLENRLHAAVMESINRIGEAQTKARLAKWIEANSG